MKKYILELKSDSILLKEFKKNSLKASLNFTHKNAEKFAEIYYGEK
jgi:hypothetical protein